LAELIFLLGHISFLGCRVISCLIPTRGWHARNAASCGSACARRRWWRSRRCR